MTRLRYAAALFDLDGTLIDSSQDLLASVRYGLRAVSDREPPPDDTITMEIGKPLETILSDLGYPTSDSNTSRFVEEYRMHYAEHFNENTRPYPGVEETLGELRNAGVKLSLVTTKHQSQAEMAAQGAGIAVFFNYVHGWQEGRKHKPDPEPFLTAACRLGVDPAQALVVGDTEQDILAARAGGFDCCAVTYGFRPVMMLRQLRPDFMVSRIRDVVDIVLT